MLALLQVRGASGWQLEEDVYQQYRPRVCPHKVPSELRQGRAQRHQRLPGSAEQVAVKQCCYFGPGASHPVYNKGI